MKSEEDPQGGLGGEGFASHSVAGCCFLVFGTYSTDVSKVDLRHEATPIFSGRGHGHLLQLLEEGLRMGVLFHPIVCQATPKQDSALDGDHDTGCRGDLIKQEDGFVVLESFHAGGCLQDGVPVRPQL